MTTSQVLGLLIFLDRVWDTPWWRFQNITQTCHSCPDMGIQRFWVHNLWNWRMQTTCLSSLLTTTTTKVCEIQMEKPNEKSQENSDLKLFSIWSKATGCLASLPPLWLKPSNQGMFPLWFEMSLTRNLPIRTLDGARWESLCSSCRGTIFSALAFQEQLRDIADLTENLSLWYSSDKLPLISHSSNIH